MSIGINKISDVMGIPLRYTSGAVNGCGTVVVTPAPGLQLRLKVKAIHEVITDSVVVFFSVGEGDLHLMVACYEKTSTISAFLIDNSKMKTPLSKLLSPQDLLRDVFSKLKPCIAAAFALKEGAWIPLKTT